MIKPQSFDRTVKIGVCRGEILICPNCTSAAAASVILTGGCFYPGRLPQKQWFSYYCTCFSRVEMNVTFYRLPKPESFIHWRLAAPDNFIFNVKGNRFITNIKRLIDTELPLVRFFDGALLLGLPHGTPGNLSRYSVRNNREGIMMTPANDKKLGEKSFLFCPECKEECIFVWAVWSGMEFYGYPPKQEYGWKCSICGSTFPEVSA